MFNKEKAEAQRQELLDQIMELRADIKRLTKARDKELTATYLTDEINALKSQITDLEINKSKIVEKHEREKREVEHMVGLQKQRADFEQKKAAQEAVFKVREENLVTEKRRFEEQMKFNNERFEKTEQYIKDIMSEVLKRLPDVTMDITQKR